QRRHVCSGRVVDTRAGGHILGRRDRRPFCQYRQRHRVLDRRRAVAREGGNQAMTATRIPEGVFAPVATIFDSAGALDLEAFQSNLSWYATSPLDGVVLLGSNGEFASLDGDEKLRVIEAGVEAIGGRKVVMAGTGVESTRGTIELTKRAAALGIDYAL